MSDGLKDSLLPGEDSPAPAPGGPSPVVEPVLPATTAADEPAGGRPARPAAEGRAGGSPPVPARRGVGPAEGTTAGTPYGYRSGLHRPASAFPRRTGGSGNESGTRTGAGAGTGAGAAPGAGSGSAAGAAAGSGAEVRDLAGLVPLSPGTRVHGTITGIVGYGAFLVTDDGRRGLIHISEISDWYVERAEDYFYKGERVQVEVVHFDPNSGKYAFSTRRLGGKQPLANRYADRLLELHRHGIIRSGYKGWAREPGRWPWRGERRGGTGTASTPGPSGTAATGSPGRTNRPAGRNKPGSRPAAGALAGTGQGAGPVGPGSRPGGSRDGTGQPAAGASQTPGARTAGPAAVQDDTDLLQLLRRHVGQVSPAARAELDRLVQAYGIARVGLVLAQVLEGMDRSLQVVEAAGKRLAAGAGASA
ncbi:RNA binding S1 domain protein [Thermaerobacter marianensis DSM 12885]|uniref:RNA binding S1 domain protein n=1 Tax=Thermaerobacter marianensis (strain ATCC 700841 / DSM 12885 / JCM 10246 / 7p75a) TaxID=644966 RepID=E6SLN8_THEM7|nr:S1 RNA-binding domain-containing protein [Thermaerobacter marianensis]ADU50305.1 RNA binding S1 domain protein [Thermaerobacter marianensis DSM 12885]